MVGASAGIIKVRFKTLRRQRRRGRTPHLGPEVLRIARVAAELERDQVIFVVVRERLVLELRRGELLLLQVVRVRGGRATATALLATD